MTDTTIPGDQTQGVYYNKDFNLISLNFLSGINTTIDLRPIMIEMSYYEDIFSNFISGEIVVKDALGLITVTNTHGNEYVRVAFDKDGSSLEGTVKSRIDNIFRVFKISKRQRTTNMDSDVYVIHFCSDEVLLSEQYKVNQYYPSTTISDIITSILNDYLETNKSLKIEQTLNAYNFIVPNLKPFEAINWLATYARSGKTGNKGAPIGADMLFFENNYGYNFASLQTLFQQPVKTSNVFRYDPKNVGLSSYGKGTDRNVFNILTYEFLDSFDTLEGLSNGTFANRLLSFDPILRRYTTTDFNYSDYQKKAYTLNKNPIINNTENRMGDALYESPEGCYKLAVSNRSQSDVPYIKQNSDPTALVKDVFVETFISMRKAQLALSNYTRIKFFVAGDPRLTIGDLITLNILDGTPASDANQKPLDPYYSGQYIITAVRHMIQPAAYTCVVEVAKESNPTPYVSVDNTSALRQSAAEGILNG